MSLIASPNYKFYLIADDLACGDNSLLYLVEKVIDFGITCVQLRMKNKSLAEIALTGEKLQKILMPKKIPLIINDHITVVKEIDADGVHLGQKDSSIEYARETLGNKIIGLSVENYKQAQVCQNYKVDYFGVGPLFATATKLDAPSLISYMELEKIINILPKPIVVIGGINKSNISLLPLIHVSGVAIAAAVLSAPDPALATVEIAHILDQKI